MPASTESDTTEKTQTIRATSNFSQAGSRPSSPANNQLEQEALVEPKEFTAQGGGTKSFEDERQKAKTQIEEIVNRLMKNPNEPSKALLTADDIIPIIIRSRESLMLDAALIELEAPIVIVGDLHGQFADAIAIFDQNGRPPSTKYLFLGDYIDRGENSIETVVLLLGLKLLYPESIFLLRGNHECRAINRVYGFFDEVKSKFNMDLWDQFQLTFNCLPICARISGRILAMHGGLSRDLNSWKMFSDIRRPCEIPTYGVLCDLLWADPTTENVQFAPSARGISSTFGEDYVIQFCKDLNLDLVVRAHQVVMDGYEFFASRRMITIFSAPYYCKEFGNSSSVLSVSKDLECHLNVRYPKGIILEETGNVEEETPDPAPLPSPGVGIVAPKEASPPSQDQKPNKDKPKTPPQPAIAKTPPQPAVAKTPPQTATIPKTPPSKTAIPKASTPKKEETKPAATSPKVISTTPPTTEKSSPTTARTPISAAKTPKKSLDDSHNHDSDDSNKIKKSSNRFSVAASKIPPKSSTGSSEKISKKGAASDPTHSSFASGYNKDKSMKKKAGSARQINDRSYKRQKSPVKINRSNETADKPEKKNRSNESGEKPLDSSMKKIKTPKTAFEQKLMASDGSSKTRRKKHRSKDLDQSQKNSSEDLNASQKKRKKPVAAEKQQQQQPGSKEPEKKTAAEHLAAIQNRSQTPGPTNRVSDKSNK